MANEGVERPDPFLASGVSLGKPTTEVNSVDKVDNAFFLDEDGNLHLRDAWITTQTDIKGNPLESVTLRDLWTRVNGIFVQDGKLYFKDSSTKRAYSLEELVGAYQDTKNRFVQGGIWWVGRTSITNAECENILVNVNGDPNIETNGDNARIYTKDSDGNYPPNAIGTKVFSIDQYLNNNMSSFQPTGFKRTDDGSFRWHDVPNLQILVPAIDENKITTLIAKISIRTIKNDNPILFRLYDEITGQTLDTVAVGNNSREPVEQQPILTFSGKLPTFASEFERLNCQCPTEEQKESFEEEPPHRIKVQFYVDDQITDDVLELNCVDNNDLVTLEETETILHDSLERRLFGFPNSLTNEPITNASIDCVIFDVDTEDKVGRKSGTIDFANQDLQIVEFDRAFSSTDYSISISNNKNINMFYTNKRKTGFTIRAEKKFTGSVDWIATKLKFEGNA
jgi:hypothetical protein